MRGYGTLALIDMAKQFAVAMVAASGGIFLLPIAHLPIAELRSKERRNIIAGTLVLTVLIVLVAYGVSSRAGQYTGLTSLLLGGMLGGSLVGLGLLFTLFKRRLWGIWSGSVGAGLFLLCMLFWVAVGSPWFP
jgi:hypothetical protein